MGCERRKYERSYSKCVREEIEEKRGDQISSLDSSSFSERSRRRNEKRREKVERK
jgi:hypothetical protein